MGVPKNEGRSLSPFGCQFSAAAPLLPDGSPSSAAVVQLASDVRCSRLLKTTSVQELLLKLALQMARDDYETRRERQRQGVQLAKVAGKYTGRKADLTTHQRIVALRGAGHTIERTAELAGCSISQVKRIWALHRAKT